MSTVDKNPVVKTRSGEVRGSEASGVVDEFEMKARVNEILNRRPTVGLARDGERLVLEAGERRPFAIVRVSNVMREFPTVAVLHRRQHTRRSRMNVQLDLRDTRQFVPQLGDGR